MNKRRWWITAVMLLLVGLICGCSGQETAVSPPTSTPIPTPMATTMPIEAADWPYPLSATNKLGPIDNYVVYYGLGQAEQLAQFDLAIVQPNTLTADEVRQLQAQDTKVIVYLSVGEAEGTRPWWSQVEMGWILGTNPNWGSLYVDANQVGWRDLLVETAVPTLLEIPFDGFFLDTLDTVDLFPETIPGMISLVSQLRETYPDKIIVQNRGFTVLDETAPFVDALMFESMSGTYDFTANQYLRTERVEEPRFVADAVQKHGLVGLVLDYARADDLATIQWAAERARELDFVPSVSAIMLNEIYLPDLSQAGADIQPNRVAYRADGENVIVTTTLYNQGLAEADEVPIRLKVGRDHDLLAETAVSLAASDKTQWEATWPDPPEDLTLVRVEVGPASAPLAVYETTYLSAEVFVDLDTQQLREGNGPDLFATYLAQAPVIDGSLDEWTDVPVSAVIDQAEQVGWVESSETSWDGPTDLSTTIQLAWNDEALYLALTVTDDEVVQQLWGEGIWQGDHVEVWLDAALQADFDESLPSGDDFQFGFSPGSADGEIPADFAIWQPPMLRTDYETAVTHAAAITTDGYIIEFRIPWQLLPGAAPAPGLALGITIEPSDTDTPGRTAQELMMSTSPASPANWGNPTYRNNLFLQRDDP